MPDVFSEDYSPPVLDQEQKQYAERRDKFLESPLPSSEESERCILGAILLDPERIHDISAYLTPAMFYSPLYRRIYQAMLTIAYGDSGIKGIDPITVGEILKREGSIESMGGIATITNLTFGLPHFANIDDYITTIKGKSALRDRVRACNQITSLCLAQDDASDRILQKTEIIFHEHVELSGRSVISNVSSMASALDSFDQKALQWQAGKSTSVPSPFPLLNRRLSERGFALGDLSLIAARPSDGKTTLGVQNALYAAEHACPALIITLEMSKEDIIQKILAGYARVPNYRINADLFNSERMNDREAVGRIRAAEAKLKNIPLFIDEDSRSLSMILSTITEYVTKYGVFFVFVDYGQIIKNDLAQRGDTRDREVGQIAEELKALSKRQTKTKPKHHTQLAIQLKRLKGEPTIDDLRECITGDSMLTDAITGQRNTVEEYFKSGVWPTVFSLTNQYKLQPSDPSEVIQSGIKDIYKLQTRSGRELRSSDNHPYLTIHGWKQLKDLQIGEEIAVPRELQIAGNPNILNANQARLLGYLISDGTYAKQRSVGFISNDPVIIEDARAICFEQFGFHAQDKPHWSGIGQLVFTLKKHFGPNRNPFIHWLQELGIHGDTTTYKQVPEAIFKATPRIIAELIAGLYTGDGSIITKKDGGLSVKYTSTSRILLHQLQSLLLRLGILSTITKPNRHTKSTVDIADLLIHNRKDIFRFASTIPLLGRKGQQLQAMVQCILPIKNNPQIDCLPLSITNEIERLKTEQGLSWNRLGYRCQNKRISRQHLSKVADVLKSEKLVHLATSDIFWDQVKSIKPDGREMTYDLIVPGTHNFVANDILIHNSGSLEQVADLVLAPFGEKPKEETVLREMKLMCLKQRKGRPGWRLPFTLHGDWQRFYDTQNMDDDQQAITGSLNFGPEGAF